MVCGRLASCNSRSSYLNRSSLKIIELITYIAVATDELMSRTIRIREQVVERVLMEEYKEYQKDLCCVFVAYNRVPRDKVRKSGVAEIYARMLLD